MKTGFIAILISLFLVQCRYDNKEDLFKPGTADCDTAVVTYTKNIAPIMSRNCTPSCHDGTAGSEDYRDYATLRFAVENNDLIARIKHETYSPMPKNAPKLDDCKIIQFEKWVKAGMPQ